MSFAHLTHVERVREDLAAGGHLAEVLALLEALGRRQLGQVPPSLFGHGGEVGADQHALRIWKLVQSEAQLNLRVDFVFHFVEVIKKNYFWVFSRPTTQRNICSH